MKSYYKSKSLDKFSIKTKEFNLERLHRVTHINKDNYIKKYLFNEYVYNVCNSLTFKYLLIIRYKPINNYSNCTLINTITNEQIDFISKDANPNSIYTKINYLIKEFEKDIREQELYRALRIKAYETSSLRH